MDATALAAAIRAGDLTAREAVEASIARIEEHDAVVGAVAHTRFEEALAEVDAGLPDGPLRGVPVLVKDLYADVAGLPSSRGSRLFAEHVPARDSELVRRYRAAGMVVLGTTNVPEFGLNASTLTGVDVYRAMSTAQRVGWQLGHQLRGSAERSGVEQGGLDLVLAPTLAEPVPPLGLLDTARPESIWEHGGRYSAFTSVFNLTGQPAISVPFGTDRDGLPIGIQLAADLGGEGLLLAVAGQIEAAAPWPLLAPGY